MSAPRTPNDALRAARALLDPPGTWLPRRSFGALDGFGKARGDSRCPEAVRFGVMAALRRVGGRDEVRIAAADLLCRAVGARFFSAWEEAPERTEAEVLATLDLAIVHARPEECRP